MGRGLSKMGIIRRLSLVMKSIMANTSERLDQMAAQEEIREARAKAQATDELIKDVQTAAQPASALRPPRPMQIPDKLAADYQLLGLNPNAELAQVEEAWRRLAGRADPKRFPAGSEEEKRAAEILKSLNDSYARIREHLNPTEGRFGQLEL